MRAKTDSSATLCSRETYVGRPADTGPVAQQTRIRVIRHGTRRPEHRAGEYSDGSGDGNIPAGRRSAPNLGLEPDYDAKEQQRVRRVDDGNDVEDDVCLATFFSR